MKSSVSTPRRKPPLPAIRLGSVERRGETRYGTLLARFMRVLSLLWVVQGLVHWTPMLTSDEGSLDLMSGAGVSAVLFFAVIDLIAAVGLWLGTGWGGVVWLVAVAGQWFAMLLLPGFFDYDLPVAVADAILVVLYFFLTYEAARENAPYV